MGGGGGGMAHGAAPAHQPVAPQLALLGGGEGAGQAFDVHQVAQAEPVVLGGMGAGMQEGGGGLEGGHRQLIDQQDLPIPVGLGKAGQAFIDATEPPVQVDPLAAVGLLAIEGES